MSRYIDADKKLTITVYDDEHEENIDRYMTIEEILNTYTSEGCPTTADVVEVVRCKNCMWNKSTPHNPICANDNMPKDVGFFCADGERREDDGIH